MRRKNDASNKDVFNKNGMTDVKVLKESYQRKATVMFGKSNQNTNRS